VRASPAARRLGAALDKLGEGALRLAYHAAVPVVVDATLLNLLRVNFFLDPPDSLGFETEAELLLSPLFREIGEGLFEIEPGVRNLLLTGLYSRYGEDRVRQVALLLEQYTDATPAWRSLPELERAQQLTAVSFLDPVRAAQWLESNASGASAENLGREWYVAMSRHIAELSSVTTANEEIAHALARLEHEDIQVRLEAIQSLDALTRLPEASLARVVPALCGLIETRAPASPDWGKLVPADAQAALSFIGTHPHGGFEVNGIVLNGADLTGLDFSEGRFGEVHLSGVQATGINLTNAHFTGIIRNSSMNGALLNSARLVLAELKNVSLVGASLVNARIAADQAIDVNLSNADVRGSRIDIAEARNLTIPDLPDDDSVAGRSQGPSAERAVNLAELPEDVARGLQSPLPAIRLGAVAELAKWLTDPDSARMLAARQALQKTADNDIPVVAEVAHSWLERTLDRLQPLANAATAPHENATVPAVATQGTARSGIAMLGGPGSGKTTYLASLKIALLRQPDLGWSLTGDNPGSAQAMISFLNDMTANHRFPQATIATVNYLWSLEAELPIRERAWYVFSRRKRHFRIPLELIDTPDEVANADRLYSREISKRLTDSLSRSAGIMLFLDPVTEFNRGDAFRHTYGVLAQLRNLAQRRDKLPHYVAVCITKFDEIRVFESAYKLKMLEIGPGAEEFPRVPDRDAEAFFSRLVRLSPSDNAGLILPMLHQTFHKERVRFFVTSAIGFYLNPTLGVFDPDDYQNHIPQVGPEPARIRGAIYPINVIEPILWLGENVARTGTPQSR